MWTHTHLFLHVSLTCQEFAAPSLTPPPQKQQGLETELGAETADQVTVEVSTAGAERTLRVPQDLERFKERT